MRQSISVSWGLFFWSRGRSPLRLMITTCLVALFVYICGVQQVPASIITLAPVADGEYNVRSNGSAGSSNTSTMRMGIVQVGSQYRVARNLIKFDLSGIDLGSVLSATFDFTVYSEYGMGGVSGPNDDIEVYRSSNDSWSESGTTLSGVPFLGLPLDASPLGTFDMPSYVDYTTGGMPLSVDLLGGGWAPADEDGFLSLVLRKTPDYQTTTKRYYTVLTKEWNTDVGPSALSSFNFGVE